MWSRLKIYAGLTKRIQTWTTKPTANQSAAHCKEGKIAMKRNITREHCTTEKLRMFVFVGFCPLVFFPFEVMAHGQEIKPLFISSLCLTSSSKLHIYPFSFYFSQILGCLSFVFLLIFSLSWSTFLPVGWFKVHFLPQILVGRERNTRMFLENSNNPPNTHFSTFCCDVGTRWQVLLLQLAELNGAGPQGSAGGFGAPAEFGSSTPGFGGKGSVCVEHI